MKTFDWKNIISTDIFVLKIVGLWPKNNVFKLNLYSIYTFSINIFVNGHNFFQTAFIGLIYKDLQALAAIIFVLLTDWLETLKVCYFVRNMKILKALMGELQCAEFQPNKHQQEKLLPANTKPWTIIYYTITILSVGTVTCWSIFPIVDGSYQEFRLPFFAWYPYNTKVAPMYQITYLYQVFSIWFLAISNVNMDTFLAALMTFVSSQCDILCDNLRNVSSDDFNRKMVACIKHHKKIVRYCFECLVKEFGVISIS